jgi:hexulose-6-phosphate isomerase
MQQELTRRGFMKAGAGAGIAAGLGVGAGQRKAWAVDPVWPTHKALITAPPNESVFTEIKRAGFNGVEANLWSPKEGLTTPDEAAKARELAGKMGLRVHTVLRGWAEFNSDDPEKVKASVDHTIYTLKAAQGYGADAILLVGGRIGDMAMPAPGQFKVEFDPKNGHLLRVAEGDNAQYQDYIKAHDHAYDSFVKEIGGLIPVAEETKVVIGVENVWNNMFINPHHFALLIDSFKSRWVRAYFDIGNQVKYRTPPEDWIRVLGKRIIKLHVKDYKIDPPNGEEWPSLREGSVNWPAVTTALAEVGYQGWFTIEGSGGLPYDQRRERLDLILAGA